MKAGRDIEILATGFRAGYDKLSKQRNERRSEYSHDFSKLYASLEDEVFTVYSAIQQKNKAKIFSTAGAVIVRASMIAELADTDEKEDKQG